MCSPLHRYRLTDAQRVEATKTTQVFTSRPPRSLPLGRSQQVELQHLRWRHGVVVGHQHLGGVGEGRSEWSGVRDPRGSGPVSVPVPGAARPAGARLPAPQDSPADIPSESESGSWSTPGAGALRSEGSQEGVLRKGARRADVGETGLGWEEDEEARRWVSAFCLECDEERGENGVWCVRG